MEHIILRRWVLDDLEKFTQLQLDFWKEDGEIDPSLRIEFPWTQEGQKELVNQLTQDWWFAMFACYQDEIIWFLSGYSNPWLSNIKHGSWAYIETIYVIPEYRNNGIWKMLIAEFVSWAKGKWIDHVRLMTNLQNPRAIALYESLWMKQSNVYLEMPID